ncbi:hypothetical protein DB346_06705 [Verrucomicrobia bacterium LW23]|nr:hypothetical protein DB346_06705 [Verrucomicrobia bacterium LW23]
MQLAPGHHHLYRLVAAAGILVLALLLVAAPLPAARAAVGDTKEKIQSIYGGAGRNVKPGMVYGIDDDKYSVTIYYLLNRSAMEVFSKARAQDGSIDPLSHDEIVRFLKTNSRGKGWVRWHMRKTRPGMYYWFRADKKLMAGYNLKEGVLTIRPMTDSDTF